MHFFVLRHGEASYSAATDSQRPLTERGRAETLAILTAERAALAGVTSIYASPYLRAQQTAAIAAELLSLPVITAPTITPEDSVQSLAALAQSLAGETPLFVSHQPLVGRFINWLVDLPSGQQVMGTSALAALQADVIAAGCGELLWLRQP